MIGGNQVIPITTVSSGSFLVRQDTIYEGTSLEITSIPDESHVLPLIQTKGSVNINNTLITFLAEGVSREVMVIL